ISRKSLPFLKGFKYRIPDVDHLTAISKDFDRLFMNGLDRKTWDSVTKVFIHELPDSAMKKAAKQMPPEIYAINGKKPADKLTSNDKFITTANIKSKTFIRIIGRKGVDTFNITGNVKNYIYDLNSEKNVVDKGSRTRSRLSSDPDVNNYNFNEYQYNIFHFPRI